MIEYNQNHGSPFDRGSADSYYDRERSPHWWPSGSYIGNMVEEKDMTQEEIDAYNAGYDWNESLNLKKDWGR